MGKEEPSHLRTNGEIINGNLDRLAQKEQEAAKAQIELTERSSCWIVEVIGSQDQSTDSAI